MQVTDLRMHSQLIFGRLGGVCKYELSNPTIQSVVSNRFDRYE